MGHPAIRYSIFGTPWPLLPWRSAAAYGSTLLPSVLPAAPSDVVPVTATPFVSLDVVPAFVCCLPGRCSSPPFTCCPSGGSTGPSVSGQLILMLPRPWFICPGCDLLPTSTARRSSWLVAHTSSGWVAHPRCAPERRPSFRLSVTTFYVIHADLASTTPTTTFCALHAGLALLAPASR